MGVMTKKKNKEKNEHEASKEPPIFLLDNPQKSDDSKLRVLTLFGDVDEEKTADVCFGLIAYKELGKIEILENPEDYSSPVKETIYKPIDFYISTHGGQALGMFGMYDTMRMVKEYYEINTYGVGKVMSAGVLLLAAGTKGKRKIGANCRVMMHSVRAEHYGNIHSLENNMKETRWIQEQHINALVKETNMSKKTLKRMLNKKIDVYLSAEQAVEYGIADEII